MSIELFHLTLLLPEIVTFSNIELGALIFVGSDVVSIRSALQWIRGRFSDLLLLFGQCHCLMLLISYLLFNSAVRVVHSLHIFIPTLLPN